MMKKKIGAERIGLLPNYIVKNKIKFVLQYSFCIAEEEAWRAEIVLQDRDLYCNIVALGGL